MEPMEGAKIPRLCSQLLKLHKFLACMKHNTLRLLNAMKYAPFLHVVKYTPSLHVVKLTSTVQG